MMRTRGSRNTAAARAQRSPMVSLGVVPSLAVIVSYIPTPAGLVMPGLVPGIHELRERCQKSWMAGTSPAMTACEKPGQLILVI